MIDSDRVCDVCSGRFHLSACGVEIDKNDSDAADLVRDWSSITHWCGCDLPADSPADSPQCAPKRARSSAGPAGTAGEPAASREALWSRLERHAGETVRLLCDDRRHCVAEVRLPLDLEGFGILHFRTLPDGMCRVALVDVTGEAETCGQTAWMDDADVDVVGGTTKLVNMWKGSMLAVPVGCIECHPEQHNSSSAPQVLTGGDEPKTAELLQEAASESHKTAGTAVEQATYDQGAEGERHGSVRQHQGQEREGGATHRFRTLGRLKSPADINRVITTEMNKIQKSLTVIYRRTGFELALVGIGETGGPDTIFKLATPGLSPLITDQWLNPEKNLPAVRQQTQLNTIMRQNREMTEKGDHLAFSDLPMGAQVHLLKGLLNTALPTPKNAPYGKTSTPALRAMSRQPFGTCAWYPADVTYQQVDKMEAADRLRVFQALARHAQQNSVLRMALENSIYGDISWDNAMAASFFIVLNREMRTGATSTDMSRDNRVPPSSDSLVGVIPIVPAPNMEIGMPVPSSAAPRSTTALDAAQDDIKGALAGRFWLN